MTTEFENLKDKHKRIAAYHVEHPEESQGACYWTEYPDASRASARRRASALFKRDDFRLYCETLRAASTALMTVSPYFAKLRQAITDPTGQDAIDIVAEMAAGTLQDILDEDTTTVEIVNKGDGKGYTEPVVVHRPLNYSEKLAGRKFVSTTTQTFAKEQIKQAPVVVIRTDTRPTISSGEVTDDEIFADMEE